MEVFGLYGARIYISNAAGFTTYGIILKKRKQYNQLFAAQMMSNPFDLYIETKLKFHIKYHHCVLSRGLLLLSYV